MFKTIVILLIAALIIKAENVPDVPNTAENSDNANYSVGETSNDSEALGTLEVPENVGVSIAAESLINEQVKLFDEVDSLVVSSPKIRRSDSESDVDVSINDDQKNDDVNLDLLDDDKIKKVDEIASASSASTEELGANRHPVIDDANTKENFKDTPEVIPNFGDVSGRSLQQDVVLDTKGRSGQPQDYENLDDMRVVPSWNLRVFDTLNPLGSNPNPTYNNDLTMPYYPAFPRQGTFYNPAKMPNPLMYRVGSKEITLPNFRRYSSGFDTSQSRTSEEIRTMGNAYPFQASLTTRLGETPINNQDVYWKRSEATQLPRPQLPFSAEHRVAYQRSFNQFAVPRFRRNANFNVVHSL